MGSNRKDYRPLADEHLDRLRADAHPILGTVGNMLLPARTVYDLVMEIRDLREEIFRLQLYETVEQIIAQELDDEEDLLAFDWPDDPWCLSDMRTATTSCYKPAFPCAEPVRLLPQSDLLGVTPRQEGRRLPRPL